MHQTQSPSQFVVHKDAPTVVPPPFWLPPDSTALPLLHAHLFIY